MFPNVDNNPNFPQIEKEILEFWRKIRPVEQLKTLRKGAKKFVYYDGPITANGQPHYGHALTWTLKDVIPRYQSLKGKYVSRNLGWDCQGILVEVEVEKFLGFKNKSEIVEYGVAKFNDYCRNFVLKYRDIIREYEERFGRFLDPEDEYFTMDAGFIESMWWSFKELYQKNLVYEDYKTVAYSTKAGTTLSTHEVKDGGYKEFEDDFVIVKFAVEGEENTFLLAYTTTPWTLYGNLLIGVKKSGSYSKVQVKDEFYIVASDLVKTLFNNTPHHEIERFGAEKLENIKYSPIFPHYSSKASEGAFKVVLAPHATTDEGTGLVHLAPYGEEDFDILFAQKIKIFDYLDETAHFTNEIPELEGKFYKSTNSSIIQDLDNQGKLFRFGKVTHRMPVCYRTGTPLIFKPVKSWYLDVEKIKPRLIEENQKLNFVPKHIKEGMSKIWYENARNWCLSRKRFWGTPIPVWRNDVSGKIHVCGSFAEIKELSGIEISDPHRPFVDEVSFTLPNEEGTYYRISDVLDVWYDSGAVPFAKNHYPFEKEMFEETFPAEYVSEGSDQVHLWFYTMMVLSVALFDKSPYQNLIVTGMMLDKDSKKLSKSKGNYPPMDEVLNNYGADIFRLFILSSPVVECESVRYYEEVLKDTKKEFFLIYWNTVKFFVTYANEHNFVPSKNYTSENILDKWILTRLKETKIAVSENMDKYQVMPASRELVPFINDLSTWFVRRSRDRIKDGDLEALNTLYYVLREFTILISPFVPFLSEKIYQILKHDNTEGFESVHLEIRDSSQLKMSPEEEELLEQMAGDRGIISEALNLRSSSNISLRQPLDEIYSATKINFEDIFKEELNVKEISYKLKKFSQFDSNDDGSLVLNIEITQDLLDERRVREFIRNIQDMRKNLGLQVSDKILVYYQEDGEINKEILKKFSDQISKKVNSTSILPGNETRIEIIS